MGHDLFRIPVCTQRFSGHIIAFYISRNREKTLLLRCARKIHWRTGKSLNNHNSTVYPPTHDGHTHQLHPVSVGDCRNSHSGTEWERQKSLAGEQSPFYNHIPQVWTLFAYRDRACLDDIGGIRENSLSRTCKRIRLQHKLTLRLLSLLFSLHK